MHWWRAGRSAVAPRSTVAASVERSRSYNRVARRRSVMIRRVFLGQQGRTMTHLMNTYNRLPIAFTRGKGARLYDEHGSEYLDALGGIAVNGLGHAHPRLTAALCDQVGRLIHTSNVYRVREQEVLADRICALSGMQEVFFGNSGAEANEAALKLVRMFGHKRGEPEAQTIVMERAWHGRTLATLAATAVKRHARALRLSYRLYQRSYNDIDAVKRAVDPIAAYSRCGSKCAGRRRYLCSRRRLRQSSRQLGDQAGLFLMIDEVRAAWTHRNGFGTSGGDQADDDAGERARIWRAGRRVRGSRRQLAFWPRNHGTTFGGGPLAMRAESKRSRYRKDG